MPVLNLKVTPLLNPPRYRSLASALTRLTATLLRKDASVTAVTISDLPAAQWFVGGQEAAQPAAFLEVIVTAGTNTAQEKASFIEAAFAQLSLQLAAGGSLAPASYVVVHEVPATDWGYAGQTQWSRRMGSEAADPKNTVRAAA